MQHTTDKLIREARAWANILRMLDGNAAQLILLPSAAIVFEEMADELERLNGVSSELT